MHTHIYIYIYAGAGCSARVCEQDLGTLITNTRQIAKDVKRHYFQHRKLGSVTTNIAVQHDGVDIGKKKWLGVFLQNINVHIGGTLPFQVALKTLKLRSVCVYAVLCVHVFASVCVCVCCVVCVFLCVVCMCVCVCVMSRACVQLASRSVTSLSVLYLLNPADHAAEQNTST